MTCTSLRHRRELETSGLFFPVWRRVHMKSIFAGNVLYCVLLQCHVCKTLLNLQCVVLLQRTWIYVGHGVRLSYLCCCWVFSDQEWQGWTHINELKPAIYIWTCPKPWAEFTSVYVIFAFNDLRWEVVINIKNHFITSIAYTKF